MTLLFSLLFLAALSVPLVLGLRRSTELFAVEVKAGRAILKRGRLPPRLFNDIEDVVKRSAPQSAKITVVVESGLPRVRVQGSTSEAFEQQLRNVVGAYQTAQIRAGRRRP